MTEQADQEKQRTSFTMAIAGVVSLGGFIIFGIVIGALALGLWLDGLLNVKPLFTILLMVVSAPISIFVMYRVAMGAIAKMSPPSTKNQGE